MTHDYAKKKRAKTKRGTSTKKPRATRQSQVPGWVWLFTGVIAGLFIAFLAYLADIPPQILPDTESATVSAPAKENKSSDTKFDFYTLLPEREVIVPVERESNEVKAREPVFYLLQTGSFRNGADADRQRARLILLGFEAKIDKIKTNSGDTWHRVQVGPFTSRSKLAKARSTLVNKGINPLVLKRKSA